MSIIKWFKGPSTTGDQYVEVSETNPLPVSAVGGGGTSNVNITGESAGLATAAAQGDIKTAIEGIAPLKWQGVGNILQGTVAQGEEKLIDLSGEGATAIWIQAAPTNTEPLQVSNITGFEGAWVAPGSSEWFYYPTLYIKHSATDAQGIAYQAVKYG